MAHAGHAHIVHKAQLARGLGRDVHARRATADEPVFAGGLELHFLIGRGQRQLQLLAAQQIAIAEFTGIAAIGKAHRAFARLEPVCRHAPLLRGQRQQLLARLGGGAAQRHGRDLDAGAGNGRALVGRGGRVAQHHVQARQRHFELFRHDLRQRRAYARAQVHMAVEGQGARQPWGAASSASTATKTSGVDCT